MKLSSQFVDGSTLIGVALSMFAVGIIVPTLWQKSIMFGLFFLYLILSYIKFNEK